MKQIFSKLDQVEEIMAKAVQLSPLALMLVGMISGIVGIIFQNEYNIFSGLVLIILGMVSEIWLQTVARAIGVFRNDKM